MWLCFLFWSLRDFLWNSEHPVQWCPLESVFISCLACPLGPFILETSVLQFWAFFLIYYLHTFPFTFFLFLEFNYWTFWIDSLIFLGFPFLSGRYSQLDLLTLLLSFSLFISTRFLSFFLFLCYNLLFLVHGYRISSYLSEDIGEFQSFLFPKVTACFWLLFVLRFWLSYQSLSWALRWCLLARLHVRGTRSLWLVVGAGQLWHSL